MAYSIFVDLSILSLSSNQPDRIRQFGLHRRKDHWVLEPSATGASETSSRGLPNNEKIAARDRETPPPEQPHVAFQSPLLEYSSALGGGGLCPNSQPAAPSFPRAMDTPRYPSNINLMEVIILKMSVLVDLVTQVVTVLTASAV